MHHARPVPGTPHRPETGRDPVFTYLSESPSHDSRAVWSLDYRLTLQSALGRNADTRVMRHNHDNEGQVLLGQHRGSIVVSGDGALTAHGGQSLPIVIADGELVVMAAYDGGQDVGPGLVTDLDRAALGPS